MALVVWEHNERTLYADITYTDENDAERPYDLTGLDVRLYIKDSAKADDPSPIVGTVLNPPTAGKAKFVFDTGVPRTVWYRIDVKDPARTEPVTVDAGLLVVRAA